MLIKFISRRLLSISTTVKKSSILQSNHDLGSMMKSLNDKKQFNQVLELFDKCEANKSQVFSSFIITQTLKACTYAGNIERGMTIHHLFSSQVKTDYYVLASLIYMYSKFQYEQLTLSFLSFVQI